MDASCSYIQMQLCFLRKLMQMKTDRRLCTREDSWWKQIEAQQRQFDMFDFDKCPCPWISWTYKMCAGRTGCKQGCCKQFEHVVCYDNSRIFEGYLYWGTLAHFGSSFLRANRRITCFFNLGLLPEEKCVLLSCLCVQWILCLVPFHHCIFS